MSSDTESGREARLRPGLLARPLLKKLLSCLEFGRITVRTPGGMTLDHQSGKPGPEAVLVLHRWRALRRLLAGGDIAFAEAYMDGEWSSPDLPALLKLAAANLGAIEHTIAGFLPVRLFNRFATCCTPTAVAAAGATSPTTTTSATISTASGSIPA